MFKKFNIILAIDKFEGIGYHNVITNLYYIPWKSKKDMAYFKSITTYTKKPDKQNAIIMGYNTWISISKPLPGVGDIGTAYSFQFRHYGAEYEGMHKDYTGKGVDQFDKVINDLITNRFSRRILMTTYNPVQVHKGQPNLALLNCLILSNFV